MLRVFSQKLLKQGRYWGSLTQLDCLKSLEVYAQTMQKLSVGGIVKLYENSFQNLLMSLS